MCVHCKRWAVTKNYNQRHNVHTYTFRQITDKYEQALLFQKKVSLVNHLVNPVGHVLLHK